ALALLLLLPYVRFHVAFWHLTDDQRTPLFILAAGFAVGALLSIVIRPGGLRIRFFNLIATLLAVFGIVFLCLLIRGGNSSRQVMLQSLAIAVVLIPLGLYLRRMRTLTIAMLALSAAGALAMNLMPASIAASNKPKTVSSVIQTGFYNVHVLTYQDYIPAPAVRGGGIARIGDQFLLATGDGHLYLFGWRKGSDAIDVRPLPYRVPANGDEFAADNTHGPWHTPLATDELSYAGEDAGSTVIAWWFRVAGILTQENGDHLRVFASHDYWKRAEKCWVERVSLMEGSREDFLRGAANLRWRTIYETTPCLPIKGEGARRGTPFCGHFGGGRMVMLDADTLLLAVGDFGFNGVASKRMLSQDMSATYGKAIAIHVSSGASEIFSSGIRNPEGLYRDPNGVIWETEHGPRGGDELNIIKRGANYGWPIVTYGTDYGTFTWPLNPKQGEHEGFEAPFYAWLPSIGVSDLVGVEKSLFPIWHGDLLVTSLVGKSIFRVRIRENRVAYAEPIV
ncbi:MAG: PQQ-dependent sugar dehydrogenase, partial [Gammaproteobacteria bacterium]